MLRDILMLTVVKLEPEKSNSSAHAGVETYKVKAWPGSCLLCFILGC